MMRPVSALLLCVALLAIGAAPAAAAPVVKPGTKDGAVELALSEERLRRERAQGATEQARSEAAAPPMHYISYPACSGNTPSTGLDTMCPNVSVGCEPPYFRVFIFHAPITVGIGEPGWEFVIERCNTPGTPGSAAPEPLPAMTLEDFQRLPLPAGTSKVEPPGGYVLVGMPTNVFAVKAEPTLIDTELLSYPVEVRATPQRYSWDFGDGFVLGPTPDPGAAYPALTNTHEYETRGPFDITMTTYYSGEYSVAGGPWLPIPGEAQVDSAPITVQAIAGRNELVAEPQP